MKYYRRKPRSQCQGRRAMYTNCGTEFVRDKLECLRIPTHLAKDASNEAGAGPAGGGVPGQGGSNYPYTTKMTMNDHSGQGNQSGASCTPVPYVDVNKVNTQLEIGKPLGRFHAFNNCNTVTDAIIRDASPPEPRPTDPLTSLPVGTKPMYACPYPRH
jgi:hypothetical protein